MDLGIVDIIQNFRVKAAKAATFCQSGKADESGNNLFRPSLNSEKLISLSAFSSLDRIESASTFS